MKSKHATPVVASACHEVLIHYKRPVFDTQKTIRSSADAHNILREFIDINRIDHKEFFWVLLLSNANQVMAISEIGVGCSLGVTVNFKEICQLALLCHSSNILIAHNHPAGTLQPSLSDKQLTKKLKKALSLLDISLLDHLIITSEDYCSFVDSGWW